MISSSLLPASFVKLQMDECVPLDWAASLCVPCSALSESAACCPVERLTCGSASWRAAGCQQLWCCSSSSPSASAGRTAPRWSTTSTSFTMSTTEVRLFFLKMKKFWWRIENVKVSQSSIRRFKRLEKDKNNKGKTSRMFSFLYLRSVIDSLWGLYCKVLFKKIPPLIYLDSNSINEISCSCLQNLLGNLCCFDKNKNKILACQFI